MAAMSGLGRIASTFVQRSESQAMSRLASQFSLASDIQTVKGTGKDATKVYNGTMSASDMGKNFATNLAGSAAGNVFGRCVGGLFGANVGSITATVTGFFASNLPAINQATK